MKTKTKILALASALNLLPMVALAGSAPTPPSVNPITTNTTEGSLVTTLTTIITWVLGFVGILAVLFLIIGGILYIVSAGNQDRVKQAKQTITYAIIGIIVVVLSYWIVKFTESLLDYFF